MDEHIARLRTHRKNIDRYQSLLRTTLSEAELQYLQKRLSEERFAIAMLENRGPSHGESFHSIVDDSANFR